MSRRIGFQDDPLAGPWTPMLRPNEEILWVGKPGFGIKWDIGTITAFAPALIFGGYLVFQEVNGQYFGPTLQIPVLGGVPFMWFITAVFAAAAVYFLSLSASIPGLTRYALSTQRAFVARVLPYPRVSEYEIGAGEPIVREGNSVYFAKILLRRKRSTHHHHIGFHNVSAPEADYIYTTMRAIQAEARP